MARIRLDYPDEMFFYSTTMTVRTSELTRGVHLGYDSLVSMIGHARFVLLDAHGIDETGSPAIVVADLVVTYSAEAFLADELRIDMGVTDENRYGGDIVYRVVREGDGALIATAKTGIVYVDRAAGRVTGAPEAFAALFRRGVDSAASGLVRRSRGADSDGS